MVNDLKKRESPFLGPIDAADSTAPREGCNEIVVAGSRLGRSVLVYFKEYPRLLPAVAAS